mmetsp:Transcript_45600/g.71454  ORF Transcript_45600/g.71454 Transcript_45600/m.71454 type:complete len:125 (+) Transcript_45600:238-612(+)
MRLVQQQHGLGHGEIRYIKEIKQNPALCLSVRTFGTLVAMDGTGFTLEHDGERAKIDGSHLAENIALRQGSLYMVIGEVQSQQQVPCVRARVARNVDGMDVHLFQEALKVRRKFAQSFMPAHGR